MPLFFCLLFIIFNTQKTKSQCFQSINLKNEWAVAKQSIIMIIFHHRIVIKKQGIIK